MMIKLNKLYGFVAEGNYIKKIILVNRADDTLKFQDMQEFIEEQCACATQEEYQRLWEKIAEMLRGLNTSYLTISIPMGTEFDESTPINAEWIVDDTTEQKFIMIINKVRAPNSFNELFSGIKTMSHIGVEQWYVPVPHSFVRYFKNSDIEKFSFMNSNLKEAVSFREALMNTKITKFRLDDRKLPKVVNFTNTCAYCGELEDASMFGTEVGTTSQKVNMTGMFRYCEKLKLVDFTSSDLRYVNNTSLMFMNCTSLETVRLSGTILDDIEKAVGMFYNCRNLNYIDVNLKFLKNKCKNDATLVKGMFYNCPAGEAYRDILPPEAFMPLDEEETHSVF